MGILTKLKNRISNQAAKSKAKSAQQAQAPMMPGPEGAPVAAAPAPAPMEPAPAISSYADQAPSVGEVEASDDLTLGGR